MLHFISENSAVASVHSMEDVDVNEGELITSEVSQTASQRASEPACEPATPVSQRVSQPKNVKLSLIIIKINLHQFIDTSVNLNVALSKTN